MLFGLYSSILAIAVAVAVSRALVVVEGTQENRDLGSRIYGGKPTNITNVPWQISLQSINGQHFCGGSILSPSVVLTAQHCTHGNEANFIQVVAGISLLSEAPKLGQRRFVKAIIPYPGFVSASLGKDISILILQTPLNLNNVVTRAIQIIPPQTNLLDPKKQVLVSGWGATTSSNNPNVLSSVVVSVIPQKDARRAYGSSIALDQLPAGDPKNGGEDTCQGDSGGPLVTLEEDRGKEHYLAGVTSWGRGCALKKYPGMYARVSFFRSWIERIRNAVEKDSKIELINERAITIKKGETIVRKISFQETQVVILGVNLVGLEPDADLTLLKIASGGKSSVICVSEGETSRESCNIVNPTPGEYLISIFGYSDTRNLTLSADILLQ